MQELQTTNEALAEAKQAESDAIMKYSRLKHMLGDIEGIVKWARSPGGGTSNPAANPTSRCPRLSHAVKISFFYSTSAIVSECQHNLG